MEKLHVLRGLATVNFYSNDLEAAKKWYTNFLGIEPYFNVPGYIEFRIGDYQQELGIIDSKCTQQLFDKAIGSYCTLAC